MTWDFAAPFATEGGPGTTTVMPVTITLSAVSPQQHTFTASASPSFDANPGVCPSGTADYEPPSVGTLTIPANANPPSVTFNITVCGDAWDEPNEQFSLSITRTGGPAGPPLIAKRATITDNDTGGLTGPPTISIGNVQVTEGNAGTTNALFPVSLSAVSPQAATARFSTLILLDNATPAANCGVAEADFVAVTNQLVTIPPTRTRRRSTSP